MNSIDQLSAMEDGQSKFDFAARSCPPEQLKWMLTGAGQFHYNKLDQRWTSRQAVRITEARFEVQMSQMSCGGKGAWD